MEQIDYIVELFGSLPRSGPGDNASTRKAFQMLQHLPPAPRILDIGCGPGMQTVELLTVSDGFVVALDRFPQMLSQVARSAEQVGLADRLETVQVDMNEMDFEPSSFDVVWSEGAIYFMGFEKGLAKIRELVRPGGYVAVTEPVWLKADPPEEVVEFWREYSDIDTVEKKLEVVSRVGFESVGHFVLPASSWTDLFYNPLSERVIEYEAKWKGVPEAETVLAEARNEISVFEKHRDYYSYAFFVMRRPTAI